MDEVGERRKGFAKSSMQESFPLSSCGCEGSVFVTFRRDETNQ